MKLLDDYMALQQQLFEYFGYVEDWRAIPIDDRREMYWFEDGERVGYADTPEALEAETDDEKRGNYYEDEIYRQRFLPKWVYRGEKFTMICVDTHVDGNKFLAIFDNAKERGSTGDGSA